MTPDAFASCLEQLPTRPVVVASHPRSGTHLMIDVIRRHFKPCRGWKWPGRPLNGCLSMLTGLGFPDGKRSDPWGTGPRYSFPSILIRVLRAASVCFENTFFRRTFCVVEQRQQRSVSRNLSHLAPPPRHIDVCPPTWSVGLGLPLPAAHPA